MKKIDQVICSFLVWARQNPLLFRFTLGVKILLALGFIPTGAVKVAGLRFATNLDITSGAGEFFEILYQSGYYWVFLGLAQVLAGLLILWERTAAIGSILFLAIISNIFFITISYDFNYTSVVSSLILLASLWLVFWNWHRIRCLFFTNSTPFLNVAQLNLSSNFEKTVYTTGFTAGLLFFTALRGWQLPIFLVYMLLIAMFLCFIVAILLGFKANNTAIKAKHNNDSINHQTHNSTKLKAKKYDR